TKCWRSWARSRSGGRTRTAPAGRANSRRLSFPDFPPRWEASDADDTRLLGDSSQLPTSPRIVFSHGQLARHVEMALHEGEVDEGPGIGVAPHLALGLPELHLLVDVADIEPSQRIDVGQAGRDQRG